MNPAQTWAIVATVLAPADEILRFVAYHLQAGAHRIYIYLDDENPAAFAALDAHPKVRVTQCNDAWWAQKANGRPQKHQARQTLNATHAYHRPAETDWLAHIDVDEFLVPDQPIAQILARVPADTTMTRIRPMEVLAGSGTAFKRFIPAGPNRNRIVRSLYPTFGDFVKGGFLSHLGGKVFVRTGLADVEFRIHNAFRGGSQITGIENQPGIDLAHFHARTWADWQASYRFRLTKGSYRAELAPNRPLQKGGLSIHQLLTMIEDEGGKAGLRAFFDEVCADTPDLRARLRAHDLLKEVALDLDSPLSTHFPNLIP